jgi:hypothetical protein
MPEKRVNEYHAHMVTKKAEMREVSWMMCISRSTEGETKTIIEPNVEIYNRALTEVRIILETDFTIKVYMHFYNGTRFCGLFLFQRSTVYYAPEIFQVCRM